MQAQTQNLLTASKQSLISSETRASKSATEGEQDNTGWNFLMFLGKAFWRLQGVRLPTHLFKKTNKTQTPNKKQLCLYLFPLCLVICTAEKCMIFKAGKGSRSWWCTRTASTFSHALYSWTNWLSIWIKQVCDTQIETPIVGKNCKEVINRQTHMLGEGGRERSLTLRHL